MIKDDYCNFETAKLLKEKGFDGECKKYYNLKLLTNPYYGCEYVRNRNLKDENDCIAPTLQMAMKWLREVHHLHCDIGYDDMDWFWGIISVDKAVPPEERPKVVKSGYAGCKSYEEACEAAILYCLKNLI